MWMEVIVYDTGFQIVGVLDVFKSFIWTDRYNEAGDFELYTHMNIALLDLMQQDYYLQIKESGHTMIVSDVQIETDVEDGNNLKITGKSLEYILKRRYIYPQTSYTGNLQTTIQNMLDTNIINPSNVKRKISNFVFQASTDPAITALTVNVQYTGDDLYKAISELCKQNNIGFQIVLNSSFQFVFSLYAGTNRSYSQNTNPYVVFSPEYENIIESNYLCSSIDYSNVTLVAGEGEDTNRKTELVGDADSIGLNRRELFTDARDISSTQDSQTLTDAQYRDLLKQRGKESLENHKIAKTFDGEVETSRLFVYGEDFFLGDVVQIANEYDMEYSSRIVEIVFSESDEGYSVFPSFEIIDNDET